MRISQRKVTWCFFNFGHRSLYLIPSIACNCPPVSWLLITKTLTFLNFSWARSQKCPSVHCPSDKTFHDFCFVGSFWWWIHVSEVILAWKVIFCHFWGHQWLKYAFFEHFCDIVGTRSSVTVLFKFSSVSIFGDSREISLHVWRIFPKFSVWGPHKPSENG